MILIRLFKNRYKLNPDTLIYEEQELNWIKILKLSILIVFGIAVISFAFVQLFIRFIDTPQEVILSQQNRILLSKYSNLQNEIKFFSCRLDSLNRTDDSVYRAVFGEKPIAKSIRMAGIGGTSLKKEYDSADYEFVVYETSRKIQELNNKLKVSEKSYKHLLALAANQKEKLKHIPAIMPVHNKTLKYIGSGFGLRYHPILGIWRMHEGLDFNAPKGTKIYATANGKIKKCYKSKTFGNCIIIDHGYGYETFYAHLQKFNIKNGAKVKRGDLIGFMGTTGLSSGVHLHYEVHLNGKEVDPVNYFYNDLTPGQYQEIIEIANSFENSMD